MPVEVKETHQSESSIEPVFGVPDGEDVLANLDFDPFLARVEPYGPGFDFGPYPEEQPLYINAKQFHQILKRCIAHQKLQESLLANLGETNSHSHESPNGGDMKQGQFTTQEVPAVRFCNGEKDPDGGKASPVEKCVAGCPSNKVSLVKLPK
jgi:Carbon-nitrogen hydrolase/CCAAT-binding transcription factor (CBF-B/NF-YA) subunit B